MTSATAPVNQDHAVDDRTKPPNRLPFNTRRVDAMFWCTVSPESSDCVSLATQHEFRRTRTNMELNPLVPFYFDPTVPD